MKQFSPRWAWLSPPSEHLKVFANTNPSVWQNKTIGELAREHAERQPDVSVFPNLDGDWRFARLLQDADALVFSLQEMGLRPGDVISFQTPNWAEAAVINLAAALGGFVVNPIVIIYRHAEVKLMLQDCRAKVLFISEQFGKFDFVGMVEDIKPDLPDLQHVAFVRSNRPGNYQQLVDAGHGQTPHRPVIDPNDVKLLLYTSGTTGRPKAVLHSHNTLARAVVCSGKHWQIRPGDHFLMPSPVTHVSGYGNGLELPFLCDTRTVLMESWNKDAAVELINKYQIAGTVAATPFLQELTQAAKAHDTDLASLRYFACGGAAVPSEIVYQANQQFANTCVFRVFGSSEAPLVTLGFQGDATADLAATTDGEIVDYEVRLVDEDGQPLASGEEGEIEVRGPAMFMGYADKQDTMDALTVDGFFKTGDIGFILQDAASGRALCISGRKKDLIIRGGENISAKEIEDVLHLHEGIQEAAVVAMPHERLGEGICAYIIMANKVAKDDAKDDAKDEAETIADLLAHIAGSGLAKQKTPERFIFTDDFPRTASGKIRKDLLRKDIADMMANK